MECHQSDCIAEAAEIAVLLIPVLNLTGGKDRVVYVLSPAFCHEHAASRGTLKQVDPLVLVDILHTMQHRLGALPDMDNASIELHPIGWTPESTGYTAADTQLDFQVRFQKAARANLN